MMEALMAISKENIDAFAELYSEYELSISCMPRNKDFFGSQLSPCIEGFRLLLSPVTLCVGDIRATVSVDRACGNVVPLIKMSADSSSLEFSTLSDFDSCMSSLREGVVLFESSGVKEYLEEIVRYNDEVLDSIRSRFKSKAKDMIANKSIKLEYKNGLIYAPFSRKVMNNFVGWEKFDSDFVLNRNSLGELAEAISARVLMLYKCSKKM